MPVYDDKDGGKTRLKKDGTPDRRCPPKEHRFKPKQSGNPRGRPKSRKTPADLLEEAAQERVKVDGKLITLDELSYKQLVRKAGSGDLRAIALMNNLRSAGKAGVPSETPEQKAERERLAREFFDMVHTMLEPLKPFEACGLSHWSEEFGATIPKWIVDECWRRYNRETRTVEHGERVPVYQLPEDGGPDF